MYFEKTIILFFFFFLVSCEQPESGWKESKVSIESLQFYTNNIKKVKNYERIIIIPMIGCPDCIENAKLFYKNNYKDENLLFVFTEILDLKTFYKDYENYLFNPNNSLHSNIIIDQDNSFRSSNINFLVPFEIKILRNKTFIKPFDDIL